MLKCACCQRQWAWHGRQRVVGQRLPDGMGTCEWPLETREIAGDWDAQEPFWDKGGISTRWPCDTTRLTVTLRCDAIPMVGASWTVSVECITPQKRNYPSSLVPLSENCQNFVLSRIKRSWNIWCKQNKQNTHVAKADVLLSQVGGPGDKWVPTRAFLGII